MTLVYIVINLVSHSEGDHNLKIRFESKKGKMSANKEQWLLTGFNYGVYVIYHPHYIMLIKLCGPKAEFR